MTVMELGEMKVRGSLRGIYIFSHLDRDFIPLRCTDFKATGETLRVISIAYICLQGFQGKHHL